MKHSLWPYTSASLVGAMLCLFITPIAFAFFAIIYFVCYVIEESQNNEEA